MQFESSKSEVKDIVNVLLRWFFDANFGVILPAGSRCLKTGFKEATKTPWKRIGSPWKLLLWKLPVCQTARGLSNILINSIMGFVHRSRHRLHFARLNYHEHLPPWKPRQLGNAKAELIFFCILWPSWSRTFTRILCVYFNYNYFGYYNN